MRRETDDRPDRHGSTFKGLSAGDTAHSGTRSLRGFSHATSPASFFVTVLYLRRIRVVSYVPYGI